MIEQEGYSLTCKDLYLSPQYATAHQATLVNKQPTSSHPRNEFKQSPSCYNITFAHNMVLRLAYET